MDTREKWFSFARGLSQLLQFLILQTEPFRKYQYNCFKSRGRKKKVAQASSDLSTFSDLSSQIWFLPQIQLAANYLCLLFSEKELWSSCSSTSCSYSVSPRKVPQAPQELQGLPFPGEPCWGQPGPSGNCPLTISGGKDGNNHSSNTQRTQQCKN